MHRSDYKALKLLQCLQEAAAQAYAKVCIAALHLWHMLVCSLFLWLVRVKTGCCPNTSTGTSSLCVSYAQVPLLA